MKDKKINFLINDLKITGGAERLIFDLACELDNSGAIVTIFYLGNDLARLDVSYKKIRCIKVRFCNMSNLFDADVIHVNLFPCLYVASFLSLFFKKKTQKLIFHEHNTFNNRRKYKPFKILDSIVYSRYDSIICISEATKKNLDSWLIFGNCRSIVIHNFSCVPLKKNTAKSLKSEIKIGMAGAVSAQKDQQFLIDFIRQESRLNYELSLIGCDVKSGFDIGGANVKIWNRSNEILDFYDYIDIYVHAAKWEGFGLVAIEACRRGKPILLPLLPGISEVVLDDCYLYQAGSFSDFGEKLEIIAMNLSVAKAHSKKVANRFSITSFIEKYRTVIEL